MALHPDCDHGDLSGLYDMIRERDEEIVRLRARLEREVTEVREQLHRIQAPGRVRLAHAYKERDPLWLYDPEHCLPEQDRYIYAYDRVREAITWGRAVSADDVAVVLNELAASLDRREHSLFDQLRRQIDELSSMRTRLGDAGRQIDNLTRERADLDDRLAGLLARPTGFKRALDDDD